MNAGFQSSSGRRPLWRTWVLVGLLLLVGCDQEPAPEWEALAPGTLEKSRPAAVKTEPASSPAVLPAVSRDRQPSNLPAEQAKGPAGHAVPSKSEADGAPESVFLTEAKPEAAIAPDPTAGASATREPARTPPSPTTGPTPPAKPPQAPEDSVGVDGREKPERDLFAPLRTRPGEIAPRGRWARLAESLRHFESLDGAQFDDENKQLILFGPYTEKPGPLTLDDLVIALWARFHEKQNPGMTIDPVKGDKTGPIMEVKFFGGTKDTRFGQVMFECDRLMKCLSLGEDNVTHRALGLRVPAFQTLPNLILLLDKSQQGPSWARFWIVPALEKFPDDDSRFKPVLAESDDCRTVRFVQWRLYVETEQMHDAGKGKDLVSSGGKKDESSKRFADHFTANYDAIAEEYPVFGQLKEMAKLVVLADWIYKREIPIDYELLYLCLEGKHPTPATTPTHAVKVTARYGNVEATVGVFGGVSLEPRTFLAKDGGEAKQAADFLAPHRSELRNGSPVRVEKDRGKPQQLVAISSGPRGPPGPTAQGPSRVPLPLVESAGKVVPGRGARPVFSLAAREAEGVLGGYDFVVSPDPETGEECFNVPVCRTGASPRKKRMLHGTFGGREVDVEVPDYVYLTSPLGDIDVRFDLARPKFDQAGEVYFPANSPRIRGYYPKTSSVVAASGEVYRFDKATGLLQGVDTPDGVSTAFTSQGLQDGCLRTPDHGDPTRGPRPPPLVLRESSGRTRAESRTAAKSDAGPASQAIAPDPALTHPAGTVVQNQDTVKAPDHGDPNHGPRPPPLALRESSGRTRAESGPAAKSDAGPTSRMIEIDPALVQPTGIEVRNRANGKRAQLGHYGNRATVTERALQR